MRFELVVSLAPYFGRTDAAHVHATDFVAHISSREGLDAAMNVSK